MNNAILNAMSTSTSSNDSSSESGVSGVKEAKENKKQKRNQEEAEDKICREERQSTSDYTGNQLIFFKLIINSEF